MRDDTIELIRRYYGPFDVNIEIAASTTLQDVQETLANRSTSDAYTFLVGLTSSCRRNFFRAGRKSGRHRVRRRSKHQR